MKHQLIISAIIVYFMNASYITGRGMANDESPSREDPLSEWLAYSAIFLTLQTIGPILFWGELIKELLKDFSYTFQLQFWKVWIFNRKYFDTYTEQKLLLSNIIAREYYNKDSLHNRMYRYTVSLVNKYKNYDPNKKVTNEDTTTSEDE